MSRRTKSAKAAIRAAKSISQSLDDCWHGLRLQRMDMPALHLLFDDKVEMEDKSPITLDYPWCVYGDLFERYVT
jgi:hypothetical protein